jgi:ATP-dependent Clp protease protease subunit
MSSTPWWRLLWSQDTKAPATPFKPWESEEIQERMLDDYIILLGTPIDEDVATEVIDKLIFLDRDDDLSIDISLYIDSPGGSVTASLTICDTLLKYVRHRVSTLCVQKCAGTAAMLLACGTQGHRFCMPEGRISLLPLSGERAREGLPMNPEVVDQELQRVFVVCAELLAERTGQSREQVMHDMTNWLELDSTDAKDYGIIDRVVGDNPRPS